KRDASIRAVDAREKAIDISPPHLLDSKPLQAVSTAVTDSRITTNRSRRRSEALRRSASSRTGESVTPSSRVALSSEVVAPSSDTVHPPHPRRPPLQQLGLHSNSLA